MILNLTQHVATQDQLVAGVVEPDQQTKQHIQELLTFHTLPSKAEILKNAFMLADILSEPSFIDFNAAMIGGAPYLMGPLEAALKYNGVKPLYSFSQRESVEQLKEDGNVEKINVFRHKGFVEC